MLLCSSLIKEDLRRELFNVGILYGFFLGDCFWIDFSGNNAVSGN